MLRYIAFLVFILAAFPLIQAAWNISSIYDALPIRATIAERR
jgi:hypothetical protein